MKCRTKFDIPACCACALLALLALAAFALILPRAALADNEANAFNPYTGRALPTAKAPRGDEARILKELGGKVSSTATEAAHRARWREEAYPIVAGGRNSRHEVLVLLDFADPASRPLWQAVTQAARSLSPDAARFVLFGYSEELYATDLIGLAIWASLERPGQALDCVSWSLRRWDEIKAGQKKQGRVKKFVTEYDAVVTSRDYPMAFTAMGRFRPPVPEDGQSRLARYIYEAGNVNLFQTTEVRAYYKVEKLPALVVDGAVFTKISGSELLQRLR